MPSLKTHTLFLIVVLLVKYPLVGMMGSLPTDKSYIQPGDINIGALVSIGRNPETCQLSLESMRDWQTTEALAFAVKQINEDKSILDGINLGFTFLDVCSDKARTILYAQRFHSPGIFHSNQSLDPFEILGVLLGVPPTLTLSLNFHFEDESIPQLSFWPHSTIELPGHFLSVIPSFDSEMGAIVKFMASMGWTYFSVLITSTSYGEIRLNAIRKYVEEYGMCIDRVHRLGIASHTTSIIKSLLANKFRAKAVLLVGSVRIMKRIFRKLESNEAMNKLIFIGSYGWDGTIKHFSRKHRRALVGSFSTSFFAPNVKAFNEHLDSLAPLSSTNPWTKDIWQLAFNCSLDKKTCKPDLKYSDAGFPIIFTAAYAIDAVYSMAIALNDLMNDKCSEKDDENRVSCLINFAQGVDKNCQISPQGESLCDENDLLLPYIMNVSIEGYTGRLSFRKDGSRPGKFVISQIITEEGGDFVENPVRMLSGAPKFLYEKFGNITWEFLEETESVFGPHDIPFVSYMRENGSTAPYSTCSRLCRTREKEVRYNNKTCCWRCQSCYPNEILTGKYTCEQCAPLFWPHANANISRCVRIIAHDDDIANRFALSMVSILAALGLSFTIAVIVFYVIYRNHRIIRAAGREMTLMQLVSFMFGFISIPLYISHPSAIWCAPAYFMFNLSYNGIFITLLIKNVRIYRLFKAASKGQRKLRVVKPLALVSLILLWAIVQCLLCAAVVILADVRLVSNMPNRRIKFVETFCRWSKVGYTTIALTNLSLITLASWFAYLTRRLPGAFHETNNLFICVSTTLVVWVSLAIAENMFYREHEKINTFSLISIINLMCMLVCLHSIRIMLILLGRSRGFSLTRVSERKRKTASGLSS